MPASTRARTDTPPPSGMARRPPALLLAALCVSLCCALSCAGESQPARPDLSTGSEGGISFPDGGTVKSDSGPKPDAVVNPDDLDGDGLSNDEEKKLGTDPLQADSDNDGVDDKTEVGSTSQPTDTDGDGKIDALEPNDFDSDKDGTLDKDDKDDTDGPCGSPPRLFQNARVGKSITLVKSCSPYRVLGTLTMHSGARLSAEPGVVIRFGPAAALVLGETSSKGLLSLVGTGTDPIELRADSASPKAGAWRGVVVENGGALVLTHVKLRHGGGPTRGSDPAALMLIKASGSISVRDTAFETSAGYGLYLAQKKQLGLLLSAFRRNSFSATKTALAIDVHHLGEIGSNNNLGAPGAGGAVEVLSNAVTRDATWRFIGAGVPYVFAEAALSIDADITVEAGVTLQVPDSAEVNVAYSGDGRLRVQGSATQGVSIGTKSGAAGSWVGLVLSDGDNTLAYTTVRGAGKNSTVGTQAAVYVSQTAKLSAQSSVVIDSSGYGVYHYRNASACSTLTAPAGFSFSGTVSQCKLFCLDDVNSPGVCKVP